MARRASLQKRQSPEVLSASEALGVVGGDVGDLSQAALFIETEAAIQESIGRITREGASKTHCVLCAGKIPKARQNAISGVETCISCARLEENQSGYGARNGVSDRDESVVNQKRSSMTIEELCADLGIKW